MFLDLDGTNSEELSASATNLIFKLFKPKFTI